jgi:hypothetical protein
MIALRGKGSSVIEPSAKKGPPISGCNGDDYPSRPFTTIDPAEAGNSPA